MVQDEGTSFQELVDNYLWGEAGVGGAVAIMRKLRRFSNRLPNSP